MPLGFRSALALSQGVPGTTYGIAAELGPAESRASRPDSSDRWSGHRYRRRHIGPLGWVRTPGHCRRSKQHTRSTLVLFHESPLRSHAPGFACTPSVPNPEERTEAPSRDGPKLSRDTRFPKFKNSCPNRRGDEAAGNAPVSIIDVIYCNKMTCVNESGGGGNCTRGPVSATLCPICGYDLHPEGWPEHGREDEAVHELVAAWHGLAPEVREKIMEMVRGG
jgi:hypothetical protein